MAVWDQSDNTADSPAENWRGPPSSSAEPACNTTRCNHLNARDIRGTWRMESSCDANLRIIHALFMHAYCTRI